MKKTIKPKKFLFFATFLYGLLFWALCLVSVFCVLMALTAKPEEVTMLYSLVGIALALTIGIGVLRKVRRKSLSLKLPIEPKDIPYTADEIKHYVGLQENDTFAEEYYAMCQAYMTMKKSKMVQIVTSSEKNTEQRSAAKNWISTAETRLNMLACPAMYLKNAVPVLLGCDRTTFYLYPHFVLRVGGKKDITAFSYADFDLELTESSYILSYDEKVPRDAEVIGEAYEHTNKDGSPDMRVKDNPSTPIIKTEELESEDFNIRYQFSNCDAAEEFYSKYDEFAEKVIQSEKINKAIKKAANQTQQGQIKINEKAE